MTTPASNLDQITVTIPTDGVRLDGYLALPAGAQGIVLFAHGSGSGRDSPRNQFVAQELQQAGLATLLIDLLTEREADDRRLVFNIDLLAERLSAAAAWLRAQDDTKQLALGYFGASTGAAAALQAAAVGDLEIGAVVSRGGRPDLAGRHLAQVTAPTLLIVGALDGPVVDLNRQAARLLECPHEIVIMPGATHLFPEPGALEQVADLAAKWFCEYLGEKDAGSSQRHGHLDGE